MPIPIENNSWDYVQGLIEKEISSAFKLRIEENKMEKDNNFKIRELNAADYHAAHPYMKSMDKVLTHYFVVKTDDPAEHGEEYEEMKVAILNSLFHPQAEYDKRG